MEQGPHRFDLHETYVSLAADGAASTLDVTPEFWQELLSGRRAVGPWLIGVNHRVGDSPFWEIHPLGACLIGVLTGRIEVAVGATAEGGEAPAETLHTIPLEAGGFTLVAPGTWHRQLITEPSDVMFCTSGADTRMHPA